ncbi:bile acid:sodium symporter family protein [Haloferula sp.]|uniref:bile acid:sodium symporter family protein n=1 Tax=Haloferula sp. TaxID=2497595 RepID=UPI00329E0294
MMQEALRPTLAAAVFLLMLGVGMGCTARDLRKSSSRPGLIGVVTVVQFLCIPALMLGVVQLLDLSVMHATALLLIGACPSGTISNAFTFLARGNTSLSVTLTAISNVIGFLATPLALAGIGRFAGGAIAETLNFPPGPLLKQLVLSMLLPLSLGLIIRHYYSAYILGKIKLIRRCCAVLIFAVVALIISADPAATWTQLKALWVPVLLITPLLFALAWAVTAFLRLSKGERRAILFELPCRNVALAMLIALSVLERSDLAYVTLSFFMLETAMILILTGAMNRFAPCELETSEAP